MKDVADDILLGASRLISSLKNHLVDIVEIKRPLSISYALQLTKLVSKLSPLLGNLFEFHIVDTLNKNNLHNDLGYWVRQDPGFPDARFIGPDIHRNIGVEVKAWLPFATEITGRFKDSEKFFLDNRINVAIVAWIPEFIFWGNPIVIDTLVVSGESVAKSRDRHYHRPPHYLVIEPEDTDNRSSNLQQTNTAGYVFQDETSGNRTQYKLAENEVRLLGEDFLVYKTSKSYQDKVKQLQGKYPYRLDTNYAKIDRIQHEGIEKFKSTVEKIEYKGKTIADWKRISSYALDNPQLVNAIKELLTP